MSFTRWIIFASFTGGILALSLQPISIANATKNSTFLVTTPHSGSSQDTGQDTPAAGRGACPALLSLVGKCKVIKMLNPAAIGWIRIPRPPINLVTRVAAKSQGHEIDRWSSKSYAIPIAAGLTFL